MPNSPLKLKELMTRVAIAKINAIGCLWMLLCLNSTTPAESWATLHGSLQWVFGLCSGVSMTVAAIYIALFYLSEQG